jgi:SAM-dependent methyltransferase
LRISGAEVRMTNPIEVNRQNWDERATIHARDTTGDYMLDRFRGGEDALHTIEAAELGDISGKRVLHLQCHIGRDTLCLVRRGAVATGLDFSGAALDVAPRLAEETGLQATFVQGAVDDAPRLTPGPFDLVFTTWGTLCWLPDLTVWARVIASALAPGGELYCADAHPGFYVLEKFDGRLLLTYDFQTPPDRPLTFDELTTYTGDTTVMTNHSFCNWIHSLSAILGAHRCRPDDYDVSRTRGVAMARRAQPGAGIRPVLATSRWSSADSVVVFGEGEERGMRQPVQVTLE